MKAFNRALSTLLLASLVLLPLPASAEESSVLIDPALELAAQESVTIASGTEEILATSTSSLETPPPLLDVDPELYVPNEVIVKYEDAEDAVLIRTDDVPQLISELSLDPEIEYVEPNYLRTIEALSSTSDPYADQLWNLEKVRASEAWAYSTGTNVIVAVIDTAIDYTHPDLIGRMWDGAGCVGVDMNGVAIGGGCVHGFDFVDNDTDPLGTNAGARHGTHVAGIIAATVANQEGIAGIAPGAKIMALRIVNDAGSGTVGREIAAIRFAIANGARIINASYSGTGESDIEKAAIEEFQNQAYGGLFVTAAGNGAADHLGDDLDALPDPVTASSTNAYPAQYDLPGIISVAATDETDTLATFSNYGATSVAIGAPGVGVWSSVPGGYDDLNGTSMATPHVAGTLALMLAVAPTRTSDELKSVLLDTGDAVASLSGKTFSGKRVNAYAAVQALQEVIVPAPEPAPQVEKEKPRRRGGGGGGGGRKDDSSLIRTPQVLGAASPDVQAEIARLMALVQQLLALIQSMKAAGLP